MNNFKRVNQRNLHGRLYDIVLEKECQFIETRYYFFFLFFFFYSSWRVTNLTVVARALEARVWSLSNSNRKKGEQPSDS